LPKISKALTTRQEGLSREVKKISWHAQNRLSKRWYQLGLRGLHPSKIKTAIARELSSYIWDIAMLIENPSATASKSATA
jgi:transposase